MAAGPSPPVPVFALYDGHGGNAMSTKLVNELHLIIHQNLEDLLPQILAAWQVAKEGREPKETLSLSSMDFDELRNQTFEPSLEALVKGCLETAFWVMDRAALAARREWKVAGGATALIALFICDRVFVANAGDSRAVVYRSMEEYTVSTLLTNFQAEPVSHDFTPESERRRIQEVAAMRPGLLDHPVTGEQVFARVQLARPVRDKDVGQAVMYRDHYMEGWGLKEVTQMDDW